MNRDQKPEQWQKRDTVQITASQQSMNGWSQSDTHKKKKKKCCDQKYAVSVECWTQKLVTNVVYKKFQDIQTMSSWELHSALGNIYFKRVPIHFNYLIQLSMQLKQQTACHNTVSLLGVYTERKLHKNLAILCDCIIEANWLELSQCNPVIQSTIQSSDQI